MPPEAVYLLGVLATLMALVLVAAWLMAGQIVRRRAPDPPANPGDFGLPFEHVTFTARDGVRLGGWLTSDARSQRATVIFCAGLFGSMDGDTHLVPHIFKAGFDVLQFDWRGHGISDGQRGTLGVREADDLLGAIDFLQSRGVPRVGLVGFSMGGAVALRVAAQDPRVACVVADGPFTHIAHALEGGLREQLGLRLRPLVWLVLRLVALRLGGLRLSDASPLPRIGAISPRPVLFIHGAEDPFVPPADQTALYAACGEPKALWQVAGAGHREAYEREPEAWCKRVVDFLRYGLVAASHDTGHER